MRTLQQELTKKLGAKPTPILKKKRVEQVDHRQQLILLARKMGFTEHEMVDVSNLGDPRIAYHLWNWETSQTVGMIEGRFNSPYKDQPDGYAAYKEGYNWTDYCPSIDETFIQLMKST